jgi:predicted nucleotide-binding protein
MSRRQQRFAEALFKRIEAEGIRPELDGLDFHRLEERFEHMRQCQGVLVLAFAQWRAQRLYRDEDKELTVTTEFVHIANSMAVAAGKPLLILREKDVAQRGSLKEGYVHPVMAVPSKAGPEWLEEQTFRDAFSQWLKRVREHKHVFLGYSNRAKPMADALNLFLADRLNLSVLDWHHLPTSEGIMQNIAEAERLTMCGIFLFTKDDKAGRQDVPRDNVVYEAGFFAGAKGQQSVLIIREKGAKLPTDLGGFVYLELTKRTDISAIETKIIDYFSTRLPRTSEAASLRAKPARVEPARS